MSQTINELDVTMSSSNGLRVECKNLFEHKKKKYKLFDDNVINLACRAYLQVFSYFAVCIQCFRSICARIPLSSSSSLLKLTNFVSYQSLHSKWNSARVPKLKILVINESNCVLTHFFWLSKLFVHVL